MPTESTISLGKDGTFTAYGREGIYLLMFNGRSKSGTWLLCGPGHDDVSPPILQSYPDLDSGLTALADVSGIGKRRHKVVLPCGASFQRPGKVPAGEVLAAHDYVVARGVVAYALVAAPSDSDPAALREELRRRLGGCAVTIGDIDFLGDSGEEAAWCCDLTLPMEGVIGRSEAEAIVRTRLRHTDLEITSLVELDCCGVAIPNRATVTPLHDVSEAA